MAEELSSRYRVEVVVLLPDRQAGHGPQISKLPRVVVNEVTRLDAAVFRTLGLTSVDAVALVANDDVGNVFAALQAQEICPGVRLVLRTFNTTLGAQLGLLFDNAQMLSDVEIATPAFVAAALGIVERTEVSVGGRVARVTTREELAPNDEILCGLAATDGAALRLLPDDAAAADLLLVLDPLGRATPGRRRSRSRAWWRRIPRGFGSGRVSRGVLVALVTLVSVLVIGVALYAALDQRHTVGHTLYFLFLTAVGEANPEDSLPRPLKILQSIVTFAGVASIPIVSAAVVQAAVPTLSRVSVTDRGHVVVVGLGNVGTRVLRELHDRGYRVVAIDHAANPYGAQLVRERRIHFIVGDASRESTLRRVNIGRARALVVMTSDDVVNLEYALQGRQVKPDLRVVLRLFDGDFADRVNKAFNVTISRSVSYLAASTFVAAMVGREVIGTIPIRRRILLVAEVPVPPGSALEGLRVSDVCAGGEARVVAMLDGKGATTGVPDDQRILAVGDRVIVVATRAGLFGVIEQSSGPHLGSQ